jgi:structural maintenance of chromosome 4
MELQQSLNDTKKEVADNEKALDHWRTQHDALRLEEIEYAAAFSRFPVALTLIHSDDDDDDDPELPAEPNAATEGVEGSEAQVVKPEPIDPSLPTGKVKTPSYELHIYTEEELSRLKKKEMVADTELLDGAHVHDR